LLDSAISANTLNEGDDEGTILLKENFTRFLGHQITFLNKNVQFLEE